MMKMKNYLFLVVSFTFHIPFVFANNSSELKLDNVQNQDRDRLCGTASLEMKKDTDWTPGGNSVLTGLRNEQKQRHSSLGSFISPFHIITSAQVLLYEKDDEPHWLQDDKPVLTTSNCTKSKYRNLGYIDVPEAYFKDVWAYYGSISKYVIGSGYHPVEGAYQAAHIYGLCGYRDDLKMMNALLVLVLKNTFNHPDYLCFGGEEDLGAHDVVHLYGFSDPGERYYDKKQLRHRIANVTKVRDGLVHVDKVYYLNDRGGPMVKVVNNTNVIMGVAASTASDDTSPSTFYFEMSYYEKQFCDLYGICSIDYTSTTGAPSSSPRAPIILVTAPPEGTDEPLWPINPEPLTFEEEPPAEDYQEGDLDYIDDLFVAPDFLNEVGRHSQWWIFILVAGFLIE